MKQIDSKKCKELAKRLEDVRNEIWDLIGEPSILTDEALDKLGIAC